MEIPLNAQVECSDGVCGQSVAVLINPVIDQVVHLVVKEDAIPNTEYIVPVEVVADTIAGTIQLRCSKAQLEKMTPFVKTEYIEEEVPHSFLGYSGGLYGPETYYFTPYVIPDSTVFMPVEQAQVPPGELVVRRGMRVEATDGHVGKVDEFVVNPENGRITHLVMREGHLWGQKEVLIPISAMKEPCQDTVSLSLSKSEIESLPTFPLQRRWS